MIDHTSFERFAQYRCNEEDWLRARFTVPRVQEHPQLDEELFEWISLLQAVLDSGDRFTMLELGAGFGRWGIRGALAARRLGIPDICVRLIEAEPQHAAWARESIRMNDLDAQISVIEAALSNSSDPVPLAIDAPADNFDAASWYGQAVITWEAAPPAPSEATYFGYRVHRSKYYGQIYVPTITLEKAAEALDRIDLIDADVQGAEIELLPWIDLMTRKVRRIHIGTHSTEIEEALRQSFRGAGWVCEWDFSLGSKRETPFGRIDFVDGVQTWLNPKLDIT